MIIPRCPAPQGSEAQPKHGPTQISMPANWKAYANPEYDVTTAPNPCQQDLQPLSAWAAEAPFRKLHANPTRNGKCFDRSEQSFYLSQQLALESNYLSLFEPALLHCHASPENGTRYSQSAGTATARKVETLCQLPTPLYVNFPHHLLKAPQL